MLCCVLALEPTSVLKLPDFVLDFAKFQQPQRGRGGKGNDHNVPHPLVFVDHDSKLICFSLQIFLYIY